MHWHGAGPKPELPPGYKELKHGSKAWEEHVEKINADTSGREPDTEHEFCEEPHTHENLAKYCFPPAAQEDVDWWHNHSAKQYANDAEALKRHLERHHKGPVETREDGKHHHTRRDKSKDNLARRLDVHPMAAPLFADAELVYFGIEGCLKADAILSAIRGRAHPRERAGIRTVRVQGGDRASSPASLTTRASHYPPGPLGSLAWPRTLFIRPLPKKRPVLCKRGPLHDARVVEWSHRAAPIPLSRPSCFLRATTLDPS